MPTNPLARDLEHVLEHTRALWEDLRGERLFITGGTGFFGCWLLESFAWANQRLDLGAQAVVLSRDPDAFSKKAPHLASNPAIHFITGDVRSFDFPSGQFTCVIHAATGSNERLNRENPLQMLDIIAAGARRVLDFAQAAGAQKLLFTSSGAVYGRQPPAVTHIPEDYTGAPDPMDVRSAYGVGKRLAEQLCVQAAHSTSLQVKIGRGFAFVGPYLPLDAHFAIGNFIRDALAGGPIMIKGDGTPYRSYLYAADLAIWLWTILMKGANCRAYNVGSDLDLSIHELAQQTADLFNPPLEIQVAGFPNPALPPERYVPSLRRARLELGLDVYVDLPDAIQRTLDWCKLSQVTTWGGVS